MLKKVADICIALGSSKHQRLESILQYNIRKAFKLQMLRVNRIKLMRIVAMAALLPLLISSSSANSGPAIKNSWRGITPLHSSAADVARLIGGEADSSEAALSGPFKVDGGEVTFSYVTTSLAKIYRAPRSMVGKVFTIYFEPGDQMSRADLTLARDFKRCVEERDRIFYYFVSDTGVAYRFSRDSDRVQTIIYQPSRNEVRSLAVNTECVF